MGRTREQVHTELTLSVRAAITELKAITGLSVKSIDVYLVETHICGDVKVEHEVTSVRITYG